MPRCLVYTTLERAFMICSQYVQPYRTVFVTRGLLFFFTSSYYAARTKWAKKKKINNKQINKWKNG